jgi:hypothetical protein
MDPQKLTINEPLKDAKQKKPKRKKYKLFVPNIPLPWIMPVFNLSGDALKMAIIVWRTYKMNNGKDTFKLTKKYLEPFGVNRFQRYRGLERLKESGLVDVDFQKGRAPIIKILNVPK